MSPTHHSFSPWIICIYDNDCNGNYINHCSDGYHLLRCEHTYCVERCKCPSSYCISFDHLCNKICDCPHCEDESICSKLLCPGMVLIEQMGSGLKCSRDGAALKHSMNHRQVIRKGGLNITNDFPVFIHLENVFNITHLILTPEIVVYCKIMHSKFSLVDVKIFHHMFSVHRLLLTHNSLENIYDSMFTSLSQLSLLDLSYNLIKYIPQIALCSLHNLQYIFLHHNLIAIFHVSIFKNNPGVQVLLLESNNLNPQSVIIDGSLPFLYYLSSDVPRLCCAFETVTLCSPPFPLFVTCSNLITSRALVALSWLIGVSTTILCLFCLILFTYKFCTPGSQTPRIVTLFSMNLSLAELVTSFCLLSYSVVNANFHDEFGIIADQWRQSRMCLGLESLCSLSSRASLAFAVCLSVHFAVHIPSVVRRETSQKTMIFQIITPWLIISPICIAVQVLERIRSIDPFNYFCFPFTSVFPSDPLILSLHIVMLIVDYVLVTTTIVSLGYLFVFTIRIRRNKTLQSVGRRKEELQKLGVRLTILIVSTVFT